MGPTIWDLASQLQKKFSTKLLTVTPLVKVMSQQQTTITEQFKS